MSRETIYSSDCLNITATHGKATTTFHVKQRRAGVGRFVEVDDLLDIFRVMLSELIRLKKEES